MSGFIEPDQWKSFLEEFSKRNRLRPTRLEVVGEIGDQEEEDHLPLVGISFEGKGSAAGSAEVILGGETAADQRRIDHVIPNVKRIAPIIGISGVEDGVAFEDAKGSKTLLLFEQPLELPEPARESEGVRMA